MAMAVACSENTDDSDYQSVAPTFSDVTFRNLTRPNETNFYVGDLIEATAVQSKKGKLLYQSTYAWTSDPSETATHSYYAGGVYDNEPRDPKDTITVTAAGNYMLTMTGKYGISGQISSQPKGTVYFSDGNGSVTYNSGASVIAGYSVTITKRIYIRP